MSAGLEDLGGSLLDEHAVQLMQQMDIDISTHCSQQVNTALLKQADLDFVMTKRQLRLLEKQWPFVRGKSFIGALAAAGNSWIRTNNPKSGVCQRINC